MYWPERYGISHGISHPTPRWVQDGMGRKSLDPISFKRYGTCMGWDLSVGWDNRGALSGG